MAGFHPDLGKSVAIDNLSACEDRLQGGHTAQRSMFHHTVCNGIAEHTGNLGGNHHGRLGRGVFGRIDRALNKCLVGVEICTGCRHVGEVVGIGFLVLFFRTSDVVVSLADGNIVLLRLLFALMEGITVLGDCQATVRKT